MKLLKATLNNYMGEVEKIFGNIRNINDPKTWDSAFTPVDWAHYYVQNMQMKAYLDMIELDYAELPESIQKWLLYRKGFAAMVDSWLERNKGYLRDTDYPSLSSAYKMLEDPELKFPWDEYMGFETIPDILR